MFDSWYSFFHSSAKASNHQKGLDLELLTLLILSSNVTHPQSIETTYLF